MQKLNAGGGGGVGGGPVTFLNTAFEKSQRIPEGFPVLKKACAGFKKRKQALKNYNRPNGQGEPLSRSLQHLRVAGSRPPGRREGSGVSRVNSEFLRTRLHLPASAVLKTTCCTFSLRCLPICLSLFILLGEKFWPQALPHHHTKKQKASGWPRGRRWPL